MLTAVALIAAGLIGLAVMVPPTHSLTFDSAAIAPEVGRAYVAPAPFEAGRLFQLDADRPETPDASRLKLFENGAPLGPPHSQHATIRTAAGGAFSHWEDHVLFSASDGSDPRINGRRYTAEAPLTLRTSWRVLGLLLAALATAINLPAVSAWLRCAVPRWIGSVRSRKVTTFARANVFLAWLAACATAIVVATIAAALLAPIVMLPLDPTQGRKEGAAVVIPVDVAPSTLYRLVDDGPDAPYGSRLRILEDQRMLGPAHSPHEIVRNTGHGAYSHWGGHLVMSASDGSDPRTNGRKYRAEAKLSLRFPWLLLGWFAFAVAVASAVALLHGTARLGPLVGALRLSARVSFEAGRPRSRERVSMAALALGCSVAVSLSLVLIGWNWGEATSSGAEIARFLPVSDALGYHSCATSIVAFGQLNETFGGDWCSRRILYTTLLSSLMMISGSDSALVLLLQGALAGLAAAAFVVRIARYVGIAGAGMAAVVLFVYMWEFVLGLFLTEVAGFSLSLFGLVLLMSFAETRRPGELFAGCALFGVAMASRAGALLALPAVALWAWVFVTARPDFRSWRLLAISAAGLSIGAILQVAVVWMIGSDPSNTGGNFAASLYGLSIGTRDWTHAYRDFAPVFQAGEKAAFEHIYRVAFHNIAAHPDIFLGALGSAEVEYLRGIFRFGFFEPANPVLSAFAVLGIVGCVLQWRSPLARLLLLLAMGEVASAPLIFDSGGVRIFGSTIFIRAALCGAGVQLLLLSLVRARSRSDWHGLSPQRGVTGVLAAWVGGTVVLAMVISATPVNRLTHLGRVAGTGCPDGLVEVVARIGRESQVLTFTSRATMLESVEPFRIGSERFARDQRMRGSAFGEEIIAIERPLTILRAVDLGVHLHGEHVRSLAYRGELESSDEPRSLCVDPNQSIRFVNYPHLLIREVRKLPLAP